MCIGHVNSSRDVQCAGTSVYCRVLVIVMVGTTTKITHVSYFFSACFFWSVLREQGPTGTGSSLSRAFCREAMILVVTGQSDYF